MPTSRFLVFSLKNRSRVALHLPHRLGPYWNCCSHGFSSAPNCKNKRVDGQLRSVEPSLHSHSRSSYMIPVALLVLAGAGILVRYNDERRAILKGSNQGTGNERSTTNRPAIGGPFRLIDTENRLVTERDLLRNWVLLYFGYTSSPDVGPEELRKMAKAIDALEAKHKVKVKPVFITIDPQRDSPEQLHAYLKEIDPRIVGLTGPIASIRQIAQEFRVYFKKVEEDGDDYLIESSHSMYLMDPNMEIVRCFGVEYDAEQLADEIFREVKRASTTNKQP
eukprot:TRINITY_DN17454_c0_g1_i2.p1 TRINITY_DN17454_c0_g1~~TRINITY_DN17454_c0_g1_i2.p1  ORF type:complete len:278 (+),score=44.44 TRINITY_DN17454_c0_g1_i2:177-1010(+)